MNPKRILIVDDEEGIRESLKEYLELEGFVVNTAACGEIALQLLNQETFDLILSDVRMPRGDGLFLLKAVKEKNPQYPTIILMSGFTDMTLQDAYHFGARGFLVKPFNPQYLLEILNCLINYELIRSTQVQLNRRALTLDLPAKSLVEGRKAQLFSIGQAGLFIKSHQEFPLVGDRVDFYLTASGESGSGVVRWVRQNDSQERPSGYGMEFIELSPNLRSELTELAEKEKIISIIPAV